MNAFRGLSLTRTSTIQAVAPGIAEALIATAIGLAAAIPSVMAYNHFSRKVRVLATDMENFSAEFLNIAERHFPLNEGDTGLWLLSSTMKAASHTSM